MAYTRTKKLTDATYAPTFPNSESEFRQQFDGTVQECYDMIQGTTSGASGADYTGVGTDTGFTSNTVKGQLKEAKNTIDNVTLGQIPDNSMTNAKLGSDIKVGSLALLNTTEKGNLVGAISEVNTSLNTEISALNTHTADLITDTDGVHGLKQETGTWTPYLTGDENTNSNTYSIQTGTYTKLGNIVIVNFSVALNAVSGMTGGTLRLRGLPFPSSILNAGGIISSMSNVTFSADFLSIKKDPDVSTALSFTKVVSGSLSSSLSILSVASGSAIQGTYVYYI